MYAAAWDVAAQRTFPSAAALVVVKRIFPFLSPTTILDVAAQRAFPYQCATAPNAAKTTITQSYMVAPVFVLGLKSDMVSDFGDMRYGDHMHTRGFEIEKI